MCPVHHSCDSPLHHTAVEGRVAPGVTQKMQQLKKKGSSRQVNQAGQPEVRLVLGTAAIATAAAEASPSAGSDEPVAGQQRG